jgi:hypothetical protein
LDTAGIRKDLKAFDQPAKPKDIGTLLAKLAQVQNIKASKDQFDGGKWALTMIEYLQDLPADCVLAALYAWPIQSKFLPTPHEIIELAKQYHAPRRWLLSVVCMVEIEAR